MRTMLAIIENDLRQRRFIFAAAAVFSIMPFVALAAVPSWRQNPSASVALFGSILSFGFALAVALGVGTSMIGSDLAAGRLSFYFSRPVTEASLWYGKLLSALTTVYVALAIVTIPSLLFTWHYRDGEWMSRASVFTAALVVAPAALLIAHALSTMIRSRSAWIAVDACAIAIAAAAVYVILNAPFAGGATTLVLVLICVMAAATLMGLVLAGPVHLARGRTDRLGNHVALSTFLWAWMAVVLTVSGAYIAWITHAKPSRIDAESLYAAPAGPWVAATGTVPFGLDYRGSLLVDVASGKFVHLDSSDLYSGAIAFSRDGSHVAWTRTIHRPERRVICTRSLNPLGDMHATAIQTSAWLQLVMSDDGSRLAYVNDGILNVADANTGRSIASVRTAIPSRWFSWMYFASPDVVRLIVLKEKPDGTQAPRPNTIEISEFDVRTRHLTRTGALTVVSRYAWVSATADGTRLLIHSVKAADPADGLFIADARTGQRVQTLKALRGNSLTLTPTAFQLVTTKGGAWVLAQEPLDGSAAREIEIGRGVYAQVAAQRGQRVLVAIEQTGKAGGPADAALIDAARGTIVRRMPGVRLVTPHQMYEDDPRMLTPSGPLVAGLDKAGHIIRINLEDGTVRPLPN